jgi:2',3'-cyclic-nucleotide 2'-phosphodiesterase (5'-nucleotidase family)
MRGSKRMVRVLAAAVGVAVLGGLAWGEVVGTATGPLDGREAREKECSLGNLAADAARRATNADAALVHASQLRPGVIPAGALTREALTDALLYPDERVVLAEMSGQKLLAALERGLSMLRKPSAGFLQVSGLTVTFRSEAPSEQRVVEVRVGDKAVSLDKEYKVAMPSSIAKGALGYFRVFDGLEVEEGPAIAEAVADYVLAVRTVTPTSGRLRDLTPPEG